MKAECDINRHERLSLDKIKVYKWAKRLDQWEGSQNVSRGRKGNIQTIAYGSMLKWLLPISPDISIQLLSFMFHLLWILELFNVTLWQGSRYSDSISGSCKFKRVKEDSFCPNTLKLSLLVLCSRQHPQYLRNVQ